MECPDISNLVLSDESRRGLARIKSIPGLANSLARSLSGGLIVNIFASPTPVPATIYTIHSTDWNTFSRAMGSIPAIARGSIEREAYNQWITAQMSKNFAEAIFWEAVTNGCSPR